MKRRLNTVLSCMASSVDNRFSPVQYFTRERKNLSLDEKDMCLQLKKMSHPLTVSTEHVMKLKVS